MNTEAVWGETDDQKSSAAEIPGESEFETAVWPSAIGAMVQWHTLRRAALAAVNPGGRVK